MDEKNQAVKVKNRTVEELDRDWKIVGYVAWVVLPLTAAGVIYVWHSILHP